MNNCFLTEQEVQAFDQQGYIACPGQIPEKLLKLLDQSGSELIDALTGLRDHETSGVEILAVVKGEERQICRVNKLHARPWPELLIVLGCPQLLDIAYSLCGEGALPVYESLMNRTLDDGTYTGLHQDMIHDRDSRIATFCIYLDEATAGDGSVRVIPKSQHKKHDLNRIEELCQQEGWAFKELEAKAGDLLLHDVMVIHDSPALTKRLQRRTVYLEFRSLDHLQRNPGYPDAWIRERQKLIAIAKEKYAAFANEEEVCLSDVEKSLMTGLYDSRIQIEPANYPGF